MHERSAPNETALCSARTALSGPIVTRAISLDRNRAPSLICIAASMVCVYTG